MWLSSICGFETGIEGLKQPYKPWKYWFYKNKLYRYDYVWRKVSVHAFLKIFEVKFNNVIGKVLAWLNYAYDWWCHELYSIVINEKDLEKTGKLVETRLSTLPRGLRTSSQRYAPPPWLENTSA